MKAPIHSFFVVPAAKAAIMHSGTNLYIVSLRTFKARRLFDDVKLLSMHHSGYMPCLVPFH